MWSNGHAARWRAEFCYRRLLNVRDKQVLPAPGTAELSQHVEQVVSRKPSTLDLSKQLVLERRERDTITRLTKAIDRVV